MDKKQCPECGKWLMPLKAGAAQGQVVHGTPIRKHKCDPCPLDVLQDILGMVDVQVDVETIKGWTVDQRNEAQKWAGKLHMRAADNVVRVPPRPDFLLEPAPEQPETAAPWTSFGTIWPEPPRRW